MKTQKEIMSILQQMKEIAVLQLRRDRLGMMTLVMLGLAFFPVCILAVRVAVHLISPGFLTAGMGDLDLSSHTITTELKVFSTLFQSYYIFAFILISLMYGGHLFKDEFSNRTMHHLFLSTIDRRFILGGKYGAFLVVSNAMCVISVVFSFLLVFLPQGFSRVSDYFGHGPGMVVLLKFMLITALALITYGALAIVFGLIFKNPTIPGFFLLIWEMINTYLPGSLKPFSVAYYLQSLLPLSFPHTKLFEIISQPASPFFAFSIPLITALGALGVASFFLQRKEIKYT